MNRIYTYEGDDGKIKKIYESYTGKFEIGDTVKVTNKGLIYSSYEDMAKAMKIPEDKWNKGGIQDEYIGTVYSRKIHATAERIVYGVEFGSSSIYIIGEGGLKLLHRVRIIKLFNDKDFEI